MRSSRFEGTQSTLVCLLRFETAGRANAGCAFIGREPNH
ncbi:MULTISPECIES: hypothetical protein [unclassified Methylosinus]|nr:MULTISPECIES: hypothetical protein [unclassified Methylosinus]